MKIWEDFKGFYFGSYVKNEEEKEICFNDIVTVVRLVRLEPEAEISFGNFCSYP